jgi:ATP/maltotriose-dependent transcriptional regulator MalT
VREWLAWALIDLGRVAEAARQIDALERIHRADPKAHAREQARFEGNLRARLAAAHGRHAEAERLARTGLASLTELGAGAADRMSVWGALGEALAAQRRWPEALAAAQGALALALARGMPQRADVMAAFEVEVGRAEHALGRPGALDRLRRARAALEPYPGQIAARRRADELLRVPPRPRR